jgi:conjugal transfer pilus assembly protein TraF
MLMTSSIKRCRSGKYQVLVWLCLVLCLLVSVTGAKAADISNPGDTVNRFYQNTREGWFWYEDPPHVIEEQQVKPDKSQPPRTIPNLDNYSIDELWNMYPDDFQSLLNSVQKKAVQYPTENNILQYLAIQDVARRKALAYTHASMYVTQKYSNLFSVNQVYPTAEPGITARVRMQQNEIEQTISRASDEHALLFFTSPGCGFCEKQAQILAYFKEKYGWQIKSVDISQNTSAAARFNITITPTLLLIEKGQEKYMTVATGVIALTELERKLFRAIRYLQGDTRNDNFLMYDFQKGTALDPTSILNQGKQPWTIAK